MCREGCEQHEVGGILHEGWRGAGPARWVAILVYWSDANKEHHSVSVPLGFFSSPPPPRSKICASTIGKNLKGLQGWCFPWLLVLLSAPGA